VSKEFIISFMLEAGNAFCLTMHRLDHWLAQLALMRPWPEHQFSPATQHAFAAAVLFPRLSKQHVSTPPSNHDAQAVLHAKGFAATADCWLTKNCHRRFFPPSAARRSNHGSRVSEDNHWFDREIEQVTAPERGLQSPCT
jgi:hypothetical protein